MGTGQAIFDTAANRYFINLALTARYDAAAVGDVIRWQRSFEHASTMLFNLTSGRMQLGTLTFLNNGPSGTTDDIFLKNMLGDSNTTAPANIPFQTKVYLYKHVKKQPLCTVHELGHYVGTLGDEYKCTLGVCQNDPSTHECVMEFARGHGLQLDDNGIPLGIQPPNLVQQFCSLEHEGTIYNAQERKHGESCWDTLRNIYDKLLLPNGVLSTSVMNDVHFIERHATSRYALAIPPCDWIKLPGVDSAIKNAAKEWVIRKAVSGDEFALIMGPSGILLEMQGVDQNAIDPLLKKIDSAELAGKESPMWLNGVLDQFPDALGAYQHLFLLAPANSSIDITKAARTLADKRISLTALIYGIGEFTDQLSRLSKTDKWIAYEDCPIAENEHEKYAFSLQNELIELYFANTPGLGIADMQFGRLPAIDDSEFKLLSEYSDKGEDGLVAINLEQQAMGVDFPVWIEEGAQSVTFLMSQPDEGIDFSLIAPNGEHCKTSPRSGPNVLSFDLSERIAGRWILRLRRIKAGDEAPFFLLSAVRNRAVATSSSVEVDGIKVKFRFMSEHELPLDLIDTKVDIFQLLPDEQAPGNIIESIVLRRERSVDPRTKATIELSTGWYQGETQLKPGPYIAVFRANHNGQAMYASNPEGNVGGNLVTHELRQIPSFSRVVKRRFQVK